MKITVNEMVDMNNRVKESNEKAYKQGAEDAREIYTKEMVEAPNTLMRSLVSYGEKEGVLVDYHYSSNKKDGCNWVQIKPTRDGAKGTKYVEIAFSDDLNTIDHIGIGHED